MILDLIFMRLIINSLHQRAEKFIYYCLSKELSIFNLLMAEIFPFVEREAIHIISRKISDAASHVNIMQILIRSQVISETLLPGDLPRFMSNCWFESPVINDETPIVIINPLNGIVTQKRLLSGIEMLKKNPDKIVFSVSHLHHNSHPAWLLETDCVSFSDLFDETENGIPVAFNRKKHIREPFEKYFPSPENIKGLKYA